MVRKKKISLTIDKDLLESMEIATHFHQIAKSQLIQEAIELWLKKRTEEQMAKGYEEQSKEDVEFVEAAVNAQDEVYNG